MSNLLDMTNSPSKSDKHIVIGKLVGVFGVAGWLKVFSYTRPREQILSYSQWLVGDAHTPMQVENGRAQGKYIVVQLAGCRNRDEAEALLQQTISMDSDLLPDTQDNEFYWHNLLGLQVVNKAGMDLGVVDRLIETGANDVLVARGDIERCIPWVWDRYIVSVDQIKRIITVDWDAED